MIKVSVILPSYNVVNYISECIESVLNQSLREIEIIAVDAGSNDGTQEILREYSMKHDNVKLVFSERKSYGRQVNIGIDESRGEYIAVVETDDYIEPHMCERLYNKAVKESAEVVKAEFYGVFETCCGKITRQRMHYIPSHIWSGYPFSGRMTPQTHLWDGYIWNGIYKKAFLVSNGIRLSETDGAAYQDIGFQHRMLSLNNRMIYLKEPVYNYRLARAGASSLNKNCMAYLIQEYESILDSAEQMAYHMDDICFRMLGAFVREYRKSIQYYDDEEFVRQNEKLVNRFIHIIRDAYERILFLGLPMDDHTRKDLDEIISNRKNFIDRSRTMIDCVIQWYHSLKEFIGTREIVLFGCGKYGGNMHNFLLKNGCNLVGVIDNDEKKWGNEFGAFHVMNAKEGIEKHPHAVYIITNKSFKYQIREQLVMLGVSEDGIVVLEDDYEIIPQYVKYVPELLQ